MRYYSIVPIFYLKTLSGSNMKAHGYLTDVAGSTLLGEESLQIGLGNDGSDIAAPDFRWVGMVHRSLADAPHDKPPFCGAGETATQ